MEALLGVRFVDVGLSGWETQMGDSGRAIIGSDAGLGWENSLEGIFLRVVRPFLEYLLLCSFVWYYHYHFIYNGRFTYCKSTC